MKKLTKLFVALLVLVITFFVLLLVFVNPILERVKPQILAKVSSTLGTEVTADDIKAGIFPWPSFSLLGLKVENKKGDDLKLKELSLEVALKPLFSKKVEVTSVKVQGVRVPVVKLANGEVEVAGINFAEIGKKDVASEPVAEAVKAEASKSESDQAPEGTAFDVKIDKANVSVSVSFKDEKTGASVSIDDVVVDLKRSGDETGFSASIKAGKDVITAKGSFSDEKLQKNIPLFNAKVDFKIDSLAPYLAFAPDVDPAPLISAGEIPGTLTLKHSKGASSHSVVDYDLALHFVKQEVKVKGSLTNLEDLGVKTDIVLPSIELQPLLTTFVKENTPEYTGGINNFACHVEAPSLKKDITFSCSTDQSEVQAVKVGISKLGGKLIQGAQQGLKLDESTLIIGKGEIKIQATTSKSGKDNKFSSTVGIKGIEISDLIRLAPKEHRGTDISGVLSSITASVEGLAGQKETTAGNFDATINNLSINKYNFLKDLFVTLDAIPGVGMQIQEGVPESHRHVLTREGTRFETLGAKGTIAGDRISLANFLADGEGFKVTGEGKVSPEDIDLDVQAVLESVLVTAIQEKKPKIERFKEEDGTIVFPVQVKKKGDGKPVIVPDVKRLMKQQAGNEIREKSEKALDKIKPGLGGLVGGFLK